MRHSSKWPCVAADVAAVWVRFHEVNMFLIEIILHEAIIIFDVKVIIESGPIYFVDIRKRAVRHANVGSVYYRHIGPLYFIWNVVK